MLAFIQALKEFEEEGGVSGRGSRYYCSFMHIGKITKWQT
jgi:hypothetical protein